MFWIALEMSIPKIGLNIMLSLTVKKSDAFKFDGVVESDNTALHADWLPDAGGYGNAIRSSRLPSLMTLILFSGNKCRKEISGVKLDGQT